MNFGGNHGSIPFTRKFEGFSKDFFALASRVYVCSVNKVDASIKSDLQHFDSAGYIQGSTKHHDTQANWRDFHACSTQQSVFHACFPFCLGLDPWV